MEKDLQRIFDYFPQLSQDQRGKFSALPELYAHWNSKINVISRKDIDHLVIHHLLHALAIAKVFQFSPQTKVLDLGCGGGFPGIPLAIFFPQVQFTLLDSIAKKIKVVEAIATAVELKNVRTVVGRAENVKEKFDFIVSRAVTTMPQFLQWAKPLLTKESRNPLPNGIFYLKGGDLREELKNIPHEIFNISDFFTESFFEEKKVVYVP